MSINVYYQNTRGLKTKTATFYQNILLQDFDVVVLTETWLNDSVFDTELFDSRYHVFRRDRETSKYKKRKDGGGVLIAVSKRFYSSRISKYESKCEDVWVKIDGSSKGSSKNSLYICAVYLPSPLKMDDLDTFTKRAQHALEKGNHAIILGDFNLKEIKWAKTNDSNVSSTTPTATTNSALNLHFLEFAALHDLSQFNYIQNSNDRELDLVLSNKPIQNLKQCNTSLTPFEDENHPSLELAVPIFTNKLLPPKTIPRPNYFKADYDRITTALEVIDWEEVFQSNASVNEMTHNFYTILKKLIKEHIPLKAPLSYHYPCWFSRELIRMYKEKHKLHTKFKKYNNPLDSVRFEELRDECASLQKNCYKKHILSVEDSIKKNPKFFWSFVKSKRQGGGTYPAQMHFENKTACKGEDICNLFADNFVQAYNGPLIDPCPLNVDYSEVSNSLCNISLSATDVENCLKSLDANKGAGTDGVAPVFIKRCAKSLTKPLHHIFNKSLQEGIFPDAWKEALIVPIHKSGDKNEITNYRPISILIIFGKLLEKLVAERITWHLKPYITDSQHGFMYARSTVSNLVCYTSDLIKSLDNRIPVDSIYTDFSKAFDKVDHGLLLQKLSNLGISGSLLKWFSSYLLNRSSKVAISGHLSNSFISTSGVPQGSHLGPILFNAFINDIPDCITNSKVYLFADDLKIMRPITSASDAELLQEDLNRLSAWCKRNNMSLNIKKCHHIHFTRNKITNAPNSYSINGQKLHNLEKIKDLGVIIDPKLSFDTHILNIVTKCYKLLGFVIRNSKEFKHPATRIKLFTTLVRPIIEYCSIIWNPQYEVYSKRIEGIQRRFMYHLSYRDNLSKKLPSYVEKLNHYKMTTLSSRRKEIDLVFLHRIFNGNVNCLDLTNALSISAPSRLPRVKAFSLFSLPYSRTNLGKHSVMPRICKQYNNISRTSELDISDSLRKFKKHLKELLYLTH